MTHYQRPTVTQLQEGGTGGEVSEILFFSAKSKRRPSLIYSMQIIPVCLSIVARRKGVSATRRGGLNWTPISLLVGHPCKLFHIKGRKHHIMTDTRSHLIAPRVHSASIQDRDGAPGVFVRLRREAPKPRHVLADGGYAGPKSRDTLIGLDGWIIQIVKRSDTADGFEVPPRRWVIERTFAWLEKCRGLAKDWEKTIESAEAGVLIAHIRRMTRLRARV